MLRPGARPLDALAAALTETLGSDPSTVSAQRRALASDEHALHLAADVLRARQPETRLVLLVDQFEELWTQAPSEPEARRTFQAEQQEPFLRLLLIAAAASDGPLLILLTLRADFLHRAAEQPSLARWIEAHLALVSPMQREELTEAITQPAELVGGTFEPGLVEALVAEVEGEPGALPLLEYTLLELWRARQGSEMTWTAYQALGGVEGALAVRAEAILDEHYQGEQREELRHLLLRLVQPGEGAADTRRRVLLADLVPANGSLEEVQALLKPLTAERLLVMGRDFGTGGETVEVAHEALIRAWPMLRAWIEEARADLVQHLQLEQAAREWEANAQNPAFLWAGLRLANAEAWVARVRPRLSGREEHFLQASREQQQALEREARARMEKEEADRLERARLRASAEATARSEAEIRNLAARRNLYALGVLLLLTGVIWNRQHHIAQQSSMIQRQEMAGEALLELVQGHQDQALLLALAAAHNISDSDSLLISQALRRTLNETQIKHRLDFLKGHRYLAYATVMRIDSPTGELVLIRSRDGTVQIRDAYTNDFQAFLEGHLFRVNAVAWNRDPGKSWLLMGNGDGTARVWDTRSWEELERLVGHTDEVIAVAWSPDGHEVITGSKDGTARVWDLGTGQEVERLVGHTDKVVAVAWTDRQQVLTRDADGTIRLWIVDESLLIARLTERVCHIRTDEEIRVEIPTWRGCDAELAAVASDLAAYHTLHGE